MKTVHKNMAKSPPKKKTTSAKQKVSSSGGGNISASGASQRILDLVLSIETSTKNPNVPRKMIASMAGIKSNTLPVTLSTMKKKQGLTSVDKIAPGSIESAPK